MSRERVGVVGDADLAKRVEAGGGEATVLDASAFEGPDGARADLDGVELLVVAGESALVDLVRAGVDQRILPVDGDAGVRSVPRSRVESAVGSALAGESEMTAHPVLAARGGTEAVSALFDVALVAAEPARISEFAVRCGGERIARFRADGVVASTSAGSVGYNRAADGPVVAPGTDVLSVVPIAPFATAADRWVLPADEVTISVERDETPVELLADGRPERTVGAGERIGLERTDEVVTVVVAESESFY